MSDQPSTEQREGLQELLAREEPHEGDSYSVGIDAHDLDRIIAACRAFGEALEQIANQDLYVVDGKFARADTFARSVLAEQRWNQNP